MAVVLACATASPAANQRHAEDFRWSGQVAPGGTVEIKGVNGAVDAELSGDGQVSVVASKRGRHSNPDDVKIEVIPHAGGVTICAVYPSPDGLQNECQPGGDGRMNTRNNDVEVHFVVRVPAGVSFAARTVNGDVQARNLASRVDARTVNGSVDIATNADCRAETVNGSIRASLGQLATDNEISFKTVNGGITLLLPSGANADVDAATVNGSFESDMPMTLQGKVSRREFHGTLGAGGPRLQLKTVNGGIVLKTAY
jgi:hypothetical protein